MAHFKDANIEIEGLDELMKAFKDLPEESLIYLKDAANTAGEVVLSKSKEKAPVDTRNLQSKLKLGKAKKSSKYPYRVFSKVTFGKGAAYAVPLELGHKLVTDGKTWGEVKERPFLRPAADESRDGVANILAEAMQKALEQMGGLK